MLQELDRIRGRGQQGAKAPLLWDKGQVEDLLQGSPVVAEVHHRLQVLRQVVFCIPYESSLPRFVGLVSVLLVMHYAVQGFHVMFQDT